jgi:hypothetical protein
MSDYATAQKQHATNTMRKSPSRPKKPRPDWEAIEREYKVGQLSNREIGRQYNVTEGSIRAKAKKEGWLRDLQSDYQKALQQELISDGDTQGLGRNTVKEAAKRALKVVKVHRDDARKQQEIVKNLMSIIASNLTADGKIRMDLEANEIRVFGGVVRDCSHALAKLTQIERQAFGLDQKQVGDDQSPPEVSEEDRDHLKEVARQAARKVLDEGKQTLKLVSGSGIE